MAEADLLTVDGSTPRGLVRLTRSPSGVDFAAEVNGLPAGHYFTELRPECDSTADVKPAHRLLLLVGAEGVGFSRALIGKGDEIANESSLVAVLRPRDDQTALACGTFPGGFP